MRFVAIFITTWLTVLAALPSEAGPSCVDAFSAAPSAAFAAPAAHPIPAPAAALAGRRDLVGISNVYDPFAVIKQDKLVPLEGYVLVEVSGAEAGRKSYVQYRDPISGATQMTTSMRAHDQALGSVYKAYEGLMQENVIKEVEDIEKEIPVSRTLSYTIKAGGDTRAFVRVFDGSDYRKMQHEKYLSDSRLPLERILAAKNRVVKVVAMDRAERRSVFEIGKVMIADDAKVRERLQLREMMLKWFKDHIVNQEDEDQTVLYADVETEKHREAYHRWFGFEPVTDPELNGQVKPPAYIMRLTLKDFKKNFLGR